MSVFGIDFGCLNSTVAVTRNGGVDVILNEVSKRETATFVSLGEEERHLGESGLDKSVRNINSTVACIKRFIGARVSDPELAKEKRFLFCPTSGDSEGRLMFDLQYNGETKSYYPEQVLAMFLGKLSTFVDREAVCDGAPAGTHVKDCVITVPCWYTAEQRKLVVQAAEIAGLSCMALVNETSAAGIDYGIFRGSSLPEKEEEGQIVAIVDVGYSAVTVSISKYWKGNMKVLAHAYNKEVGARELDYELLQHFANEIQKKYKVDVRSNKKAYLRLLQACEKVKIMLSGNVIAPLNIENLMDIDVSFPTFKREDMEAACAPVFERLKATCLEAVKRAGLELSQVTKVELIGGTSRVPMVKQVVAEAFGQPIFMTLNATESVARGCAITAAVYSPKFRVREFVVHEAPSRPLLLGYYSTTSTALSSVSWLPAVNKVITILNTTDHYPKSLELTFDRSEPFDLYIFYDEEKSQDLLAAKSSLLVGKFSIGGPNGKTTNGKVKVQLRFLITGLVNIEGANTQEDYEVEEVEEKKGEGDAPPTKTTVTKKKNRKLELTVTPDLEVLGHKFSVVAAAIKTEKDMVKRDADLFRKKESKNSLESYIYDYRSGISDGGKYAPFVTAADQKTFVEMATNFETWLYDEGCDSTEEEYNKRLAQLTVIGGPALQRFRLSEEIPFALKQSLQKLEIIKKIALDKIGKHAWITDEELNGAAAKADEAAALLQKQVADYLAAPKHVTPTINQATMEAKVKEVDAAVKVVINKPAPKKEEPPKEEKKDVPPPTAEGAAPPPPAPEADPAPESKGPKVDSELD